MIKVEDQAYKNVQLAVRYIWAAFIIFIIALIAVITFVVTVLVRYPTIWDQLNVSSRNMIILGAVTIFMALSFGSIILFIICLQILKGKRWARFVSLLFTFIEMLIVVDSFYKAKEILFVWWILFSLVLGLQAYASFLLLTLPGRRWFEVPQEADY